MRVSTNAPSSSSTSSSSNFEFQQMAAALEDKMTLTFRNEMNEMKNMMKDLVPTPTPIKAVEERCTTCGSSHNGSSCPLTRGANYYSVYHDNFQQFQQAVAVGGFVQGNSGYPPSSVASYTRPPGFTQPNPQASRPNQGYNRNQGYNGTRNVNQTNQVNHGANSGLTQQAQAYQAPSTQAPSNLQKNLNDFKREQQDFQNEQRNFQNMMLNMFQKQMGNNNASGSGTLPSNTITNPRCEARAITTRSGLSYTPVPPIPPPLYDENVSLTEKETEVTKDKVLPSTKDIQPPVIQKSHDPVKPVSSLISPEPSSAQVNNSPPSKEPSKKTHLPYPQRMFFDSLVGEIIKQKEEVKKISDPVARRKSFFTSNLENFRIIHQGRIIHSPQIASVGANFTLFPNNNLEGTSLKWETEDFNFIPNNKLDKEDLIPIPRESKIGKECDFPFCDDFQSFKIFSNPFFKKNDDLPSRNDDSILKEEVHKETSITPTSDPTESKVEEFINENTPDMSKEFVLDDMSFSPKELNLESLPKDDFDNDDDLFEMDSNNDEWKRILYGEDFERMDSDINKPKILTN
ncbi:hypothetical protein Tco_0085287 [Tanacetum coccineum]